MVKDPKTADKVISSNFPHIKSDLKHYKITSEIDENYNCIAWAMRLYDRWVDPIKTAGHWWPQRSNNINDDLTPDALIKAFESIKFKKCDNNNNEFWYDKVALYKNPYTGRWAHAARVINKDEYHSKMGEGWDFHHGSSKYLLHNPRKTTDTYGTVYQIMKRPKIYRCYSFYLRVLKLKYLFTV